MAFLIAVGAISAYSAWSQSQAAANAADYNAQTTEYGKGLALTRQAQTAARAMGRARAGYGAAGVVGGQGSPLDVLGDAAGQAEFDALSLKFNYESRAGLDRAKAENYRTSSVLNAFGSGLRAFGSGIPMYGGPSGGSGAVNTGTVTGSDMDVYTSGWSP